MRVLERKRHGKNTKPMKKEHIHTTTKKLKRRAMNYLCSGRGAKTSAWSPSNQHSANIRTTWWRSHEITNFKMWNKWQCCIWARVLKFTKLKTKEWQNERENSDEWTKHEERVEKKSRQITENCWVAQADEWITWKTVEIEGNKLGGPVEIQLNFPDCQANDECEHSFRAIVTEILFYLLFCVRKSYFPLVSSTTLFSN